MTARSMSLMLLFSLAASGASSRSEEQTFCVSSLSVTAECETFSVDEASAEFSLAGFLTLEVRYNDKILNFEYSRPAAAEVCLEHLERIHQLLRESPEICVSGHGGSLRKNAAFIWTRVESPRGWVAR